MDSEFYELTKALRLHQRYRFDPLGLSEGERARLREICRAAIAAPS
jgi:ABC-type ATPase involved in cell division